MDKKGTFEAQQHMKDFNSQVKNLLGSEGQQKGTDKHDSLSKQLIPG